MKQFMCLNFMYSLNIFYIFFKSKKKNFIVRFLHIAGGGWMRMRHWERGSRDFITLLDSWNTPSAVFGNGREGFSTYERGLWLMSQCHVTLTLHISLHLYAIFFSLYFVSASDSYFSVSRNFSNPSLLRRHRRMSAPSGHRYLAQTQL